jgi:hypothetical protein
MPSRSPSVLRSRPRVARELTGRGALPKLENLVNKSPEELTRTLARFGIEPDMAAIERAAHRAFDPIEKLISRGQVPDDAAWANIEDDLNRRVKASLRDMTRTAIRLYRLKRSEIEGGQQIWIAALKNTCGSCLSRHGKVKTYKQWARLGLPGDPVLVCCSFEARCQCTLGPVSG